ncbi:MAG: hypothetical protein VX026_07260 [Myxococcota bacterium]|nr:hypothetical protein [Myxococcota bacterium]
MSNPTISRDIVHSLSEACGNDPDAFQAIANRISKEQRRLFRHVEGEFAEKDPVSGQVALYMMSVCVRVIEQQSGRLTKVNQDSIKAATKSVRSQLSSILPIDDDFAERAKSVSRAQPHLLDEVLWALYEREETDMLPEEAQIDPKKSAMIYIMLWIAVEALNSHWKA